MNRAILTVVGVVALVGASACGPPPAVPNTVDGGWKGTYECGADSKKISAILDETAEKGVVTGEMFLDYQVVVLGNPLLLTGRANVVDGKRTKSNEYGGTVDVLDNSQGLGDFEFTFTLDAAGDKLTGALVQHNGDGSVKQSCNTALEKTDVTD